MKLIIGILAAFLLCFGGNVNYDVTNDTLSEDRYDAISNSIKIEIATEQQIGDTENYFHIYDTKAINQNWKIVIEPEEDIESFSVIELDESVALEIKGTIFECDTLKAHEPVILHTYINDATVNRGLSYKDDSGTIRFFGFYFSGKDGTISLREINV